MRRQRTSRLARTSDRQNKKQAIIFVVGIVIVVMVLVQFGPPLINLFGNAVYTLRGGDKPDSSQITGKAVIQSPTLNNIVEATQSANLILEGTAPSQNGTVELYLNNELEDEIEISDDLNFQAKVKLKKGTNNIKARFMKDDKTSPFSEEFVVNYLVDKPNLEITFPIDNANLSRADKSITVIGKTDPDNTVTVNSFRAIVQSDGSFNYLMQLNDGDNQIDIEAKNPAGSTTQKSLKVTYQP